jgi:hypothetical protein
MGNVIPRSDWAVKLGDPRDLDGYDLFEPETSPDHTPGDTD